MNPIFTAYYKTLIGSDADKEVVHVARQAENNAIAEFGRDILIKADAKNHYAMKNDTEFLNFWAVSISASLAGGGYSDSTIGFFADFGIKM